jgi:hypothetical protein
VNKNAVADNVNQMPFYAAGFLALLKEINRPSMQIILRGGNAALSQWRDQLLPALKPSQMAFFIPLDAANLPETIAQKTSTFAASAWIC